MRLVLPILPVLLTLSLRAEHLPGGTISYACLGNNMYRVELVLYRECSGVPMINQSLAFRNDCGTQFTLNNIAFSQVEEVSPLCAAQVANSTCNGGALVGIEAYRYERTLFLSPCTGWVISWSTCCRAPSLNLQNEPGLYIEARLDNQNTPCNNSPVFTEVSVPFVCVGQPVSYDAGVVETDGHTLVYSFIEARFASPFPTVVNYQFPHFGGMPWPGMSISPGTGNITFTPTQQGYIVVVVQVDEYDAAGNLLGGVMRDFPFVVTACPGNTPPPATTGTITAVVGTGSQTGPRAYRACANGEVCMQAQFTDPDAGQALSFSTTAATVLPGATFSVSGTNPATLSLCWDATGAVPGTRSFLVTAMDGHCPIMGTQNYTYTLEVFAAPFAGNDGSALYCALSPPFALADSLQGDAPEGGTWTGPGGEPHPGMFVPGADPPGPYTYTVEAFPGCSAAAVVQVSMLPDTNQICINLGVADRSLKAPTVHPNPATHELFVRGYGTGEAPHLHLYDATGRNILEQRPMAVAGGWRLALPAHVCTGTYLLRMEPADGRPHHVRVRIDR